MKRFISSPTTRFATTVAMVACLALGVGVALAVTGAISTTDNPGALVTTGFTTTDDGTTAPLTYTSQTCLNGQGINCNIYTDKRDVWFSGLPVTAALGAGTYFFSVQVPGGQPTPNDGGAKNLSDTTCLPYSGCPGPTNADGSAVPSGDAWTNREFSVDGTGAVSYSGTHAFAGNKIDVWPYDDTVNPGGVYILAVCKVPNPVTDSPGADPRDCKYDAFKVRGGGTSDSDLVVTKDATPSFTRDYEWSVTKSQTTSSRPIDSPGPTTSVSYAVTATWSGPIDSGWQVGGTIDVFNPNDGDATNVTVHDAVTDPDGNAAGSCNVGGQDPNQVSDVSTENIGTVAGNTTNSVDYVCTFASKPVYGSDYSNTATATWDPTLGDQTQTPDTSGAFTVPFAFATGDAGNPTVLNATTTVTDTFGPAGGSGTSTTLGVAGVDGSWTTDPANHLSGFAESYDGSTASGGTNTFTLHYSRSIPVAADACHEYDNTATVTDGGAGSTDDDSAADDDSASASATICGPAAGGLTMGFWQNKNGQSIVLGSSGANCQTLATWLRQYHPFSDLAATTCGTSPSLTGKSTTAPSGVVGYVYTTIKNATCTSTSKTCNSMLKAQMLATALNVYFSQSSVGDPIARYNGGNTTSLGAVKVDLTTICKMIDSSGGTASCSGTYENVSSVFGGATCLAMTGMLGYQNTSDPAADGGAYWYQQVKSQQVLAKDAFDATNNQVSFTCP